jgi:hypothetical protein
MTLHADLLSKLNPAAGFPNLRRLLQLVSGCMCQFKMGLQNVDSAARERFAHIFGLQLSANTILNIESQLVNNIDLENVVDVQKKTHSFQMQQQLETRQLSPCASSAIQ